MKWIRWTIVGVALSALILILAHIYRYEESVASPDQPLIVRRDRWTGRATIHDVNTGDRVESVARFLEQQRRERASAARAALQAAHDRASLDEARHNHERRGERLRELLAGDSSLTH